MQKSSDTSRDGNTYEKWIARVDDEQALYREGRTHHIFPLLNTTEPATSPRLVWPAFLAFTRASMSVLIVG